MIECEILCGIVARAGVQEPAAWVDSPGDPLLPVSNCFSSLCITFLMYKTGMKTVLTLSDCWVAQVTSSYVQSVWTMPIAW